MTRVSFSFAFDPISISDFLLALASRALMFGSVTPFDLRCLVVVTPLSLLVFVCPRTFGTRLRFVLFLSFQTHARTTSLRYITEHPKDVHTEGGFEMTPLPHLCIMDISKFVFIIG